MSINIPCPHCGRRPVEEFVYGEVPIVPASIIGEEARDFDRAFMRNNPEGVQREAWFHTYGCRRWVYLHRDTRTDEIC
ncbi:MAG TPA: sarcosine oxidase subunit delta [Anaerolineae bacterium]|nr:sarcosine oxidase subunit delta [Anaerolineae bacterium]